MGVGKGVGVAVGGAASFSISSPIQPLAPVVKATCHQTVGVVPSTADCGPLTTVPTTPAACWPVTGTPAGEGRTFASTVGVTLLPIANPLEIGVEVGVGVGGAETPLMAYAPTSHGTVRVAPLISEKTGLIVVPCPIKVEPSGGLNPIEVPCIDGLVVVFGKLGLPTCLHPAGDPSEF
jgi:hypothetical protein